MAAPERPCTRFAEACERFEALLRLDTWQVDPASRSRLITPGRRTERAIVFFHGLTNSPQQFLCLAERFQARGYAILIPRLPYHGYSDRMSTDLQRLTGTDLVNAASDAVDIATGLADNVTVSGISVGGVLAAWVAQFRAVARAVPIAPAVGIPVLPLGLSAAAFRAMRRLPNRFVWWDPRVKQALPGPTYAYFRYSTHALAEAQRVGFELLSIAQSVPPRARTIGVISNAADLAVSNTASDLLVKHWRTLGADVHTFQFPRRLKLFHDLVDPLQPNAQPALVHPVLEQIIVDEVVPDPVLL